MKALCIVGSPKKNGCTAHIVDSIASGMKDNGIEVKTYILGEMNINYCRGCLTCNKTRKCIQQDDMDLIITDLIDSDIILVASPSYWGDVTGQLKVFFDRSNPYCNMGEGGTSIPAGKVGIAVAVRAGQRQSENQHLIDTINHYYNHLQIKPIESYTVEGIMYKEDFSGREELIEEAYNLGSRIKSLI